MVRANGDSFCVLGAQEFAINDEAGLPSAVCTAAGVFGTKAQSLELVAGWSYDTRNRVLFPDFGTRIGMNFNAAIPGSEVEYFVAGLDFTKYMRMPGRWRFKINSELSYGDAFGETTALPPYRNRYAGGPGSVRGFKRAISAHSTRCAIRTAAICSSSISSS